MTLQQANKQIEIHKEVAHLHNKQDQLGDKQDILQSMLMKESSVFQSPAPTSSLSRTPSNIHPSMSWPGFSPPQFPTKPLAVRASSCPPALILTQLPKYDDEFASLLCDSYMSELLGVMGDCLLSGAVLSCSVKASQEVQTPATQPSASDIQLSTLRTSGRCPPQWTNVDKLLTSVEEPSHSRQVSGVAHNRKIVKKSAAQVVQKQPEDCFVSNVKHARHSYFGSAV